jgi:vitamin B12 transporter
MQRVFSLSLLALGVGVSLSALAQAATGQPEVVVTADRTAATVDETLAAVSVFTRADIEASGSNDLLDLLRQVPGLDLARSGGLAQQTSLFLRGTNSNHVLVLIDGVRVSAVGTGAFAWEQISLDQIERIEVVRGPRAALWGSDALGGVIQLFTRRADGFDGALSVGNHDTYGVQAGMGARNERGGFDARLGGTDSRGSNSQNPEGFAFDPDDDGFVHRNALAHGDLAVGETHRLAAMASRRDNEVEFDQGESATVQSQYSLALDGAPSERWSQHAQIAAVRDAIDTPAFFSRYETSREQADWNHALQLRERSELLLGAAYLRERGRNIDSFAGTPIYDARRHNAAAFGALRQGLGAHDLEVSARYDDNSTFGGETTFAAAWGWQLADGVRSTLSYGEGFRAPTLNELYSPGFGGLFAGNPALEPERSKNLEAGLRLGAGAATLDLRAWHDRVTNLVDFSGGSTFQAINIKRARLQGLEAEGRWSRTGWTFSANATWQDAEDRDTGEDLIRRAPRKGGASVERQFGDGARLGLEGFVSSSRPEFGGDLPGYGLLSLRGSLPLGGRWWLDGRVENLLDRDYSLLRGYNTAGMTALATLRWGSPR